MNEEPQKSASAPGHDSEVKNGQSTKEYFGKLRRRLKIGILAAILVPLFALSIYFHIQFNTSLKQSGKLHLAALAESQRNTVDLFLQERVANIFSLFHSSEFSLTPGQDDMEHYFQNLRRMSDAFIDVGFFDAQGRQIGYAGPFPYLRGKDYSGEEWFKSLVEGERNYYISDIYMGFRNKPHFTIAVKQYIDNKLYVMRATLDPDKFYVFLRTMSHGKGVESALVNSRGVYQVVDPEQAEVLSKCEYMPPAEEKRGVAELRLDGSELLIAHAWLKEAPWVLVVRQPLSQAYAGMYRVRRIMIAGTGIILVVLAGSIWLTTDRLMKRAQKTAEAREELRSQLVHAGKLAAVGELAAGVAHEINNPLAIIGSETGVIRDMMDPQYGLEFKQEYVAEELTVIEQAVDRARLVTQKLLNFARKNPPKLISCDVNKLLDDVVSGLIEREFKVSNISLEKDYEANLPKVPLDPDQMSQVFLNLINNAGDAIDGAGKITLSTRRDNGTIRVSVTDTGKGMDAEQLRNIFTPFYTTKEAGKGTGLGLPVSLSIVESMGGTIEVQSILGTGSSFTVVLPIKDSKEENDGAV